MFSGLRRRGQIMIMAALGFPTFLAFIGLSVDGGLMLARHQQVKSAADMAALNGAYCGIQTSLALCTNAAALGGGDAVVGMARAVATAHGYTNGVNGATVTVTRPSGNVQVDISAPSSTYFVKVVGVSTLTVPGTAVAGLQGLQEGDAPLAACGDRMLHEINSPPNGPQTTFDMLLGSGTAGDPWRVDPAQFDAFATGQADGHYGFVLQSSQLGQATTPPACPDGNGNSDWKGKINPVSGTPPLPYNATLPSGNSAADLTGAGGFCSTMYGSTITSLPDHPPSPCSLWLPVVTGPVPAQDAVARVVTFACFEMLEASNPDVWRGILRNPDAGYCHYQGQVFGAPCPTGFTCPTRVALIQ